MSATIDRDVTVAPNVPGKKGINLRERAASLGGMVWVLVILVITAVILNPRFLNPGNLVNILTQNAPVGIIAVGMTFIIIAGGFDLSVAAVLAIGGVSYATLST